jgi:phospholipid-binding lipoprotein MlaA
MLQRFNVEGGRRRKRAVAAAVLGIALGCCGCAAKPLPLPTAADADPDNDPAEPVNRAIFKANLAVDHTVMRPVAQAYVEHVPDAVRQGVHNVVQNLKEPATAVNDLLQGNVGKAWQSVQRLAVNTTAGVAGVVDVAQKLGLPPHDADFGETLAVWGVKEGPYAELPLLGPSNPRDAIGTVVDLAMNPLTFVGGPPATYASVAAGGADAVETRAQHLRDLDDLERNSLDYYAELRSVYRQHRDAEIAALKASAATPAQQTQQRPPSAQPTQQTPQSLHQQQSPQPAQGRVDLTYPDNKP